MIESKKRTVAILIPLTWDVVPRQFFFSMMGIMAYANNKYEIKLLTAKAALISVMHELMVQEALDCGVDYILHLDADEVYPPDTPERLMKHIDSGKDVVMGLCPQNKDEQGGYVAYHFKYNPFKLEKADIKPGMGLVAVDCTGMGGVMVNPKVYRTIDKPHFLGLPNFSGPDVNMCFKCRQKGIQPWIDTDLRFGHIIPSVRYDG